MPIHERQGVESFQVRTLFVSDLHLGFRFSQVDQLLRLLDRCHPEYLYLVGDFIDGWYLSRRWHWRDACNRVVARLMQLAASGTEIRCVVGNHDEFLRQPLMQQLLKRTGVRLVADEFRHQTADGRSWLVLHGDQFDRYEHLPPLASWVLCKLYEGVLTANRIWSRCTSSARHGRSSLTAGVKAWLPSLARHVRRFRDEAVRHARERGFEGIICGHVHDPQAVHVDGVQYYNTGDWIENCTALIENFDGRLQLIGVDDLPQLTRRTAPVPTRVGEPCCSLGMPLTPIPVPLTID